MKWKFLSTLMAAIASFAVGASQSAAAEKVIIAEHEWDGGIAIMYAMKVALEDRLGIEVETLAATQEIIAAGLNRGDGSVDVFPDLYMPNREAIWNSYIAEGSSETILTNARPYEIVEGVFVPGYVQDEYGIQAVTDLANPEIAALFDSDGDGKGEIWAGPTGWGSTNIMHVKVNSYGLADVMTSIETSVPVLKASLSTAYARKEPIVFYFWVPESIFAMYDIRRLEEAPFDGYASSAMSDHPEYNPSGCWQMYQPQDRPDWLEASEVTCAWPESVSYVAYSKSLLDRAPRAAQFLSQVYFEPEWINEWILKLTEDRGSIETAIREWADANSQVVDEWVDGID